MVIRNKIVTFNLISLMAFSNTFGCSTSSSDSESSASASDARGSRMLLISVTPIEENCSPGVGSCLKSVKGETLSPSNDSIASSFEDVENDKIGVIELDHQVKLALQPQPIQQTGTISSTTLTIDTPISTPPSGDKKLMSAVALVGSVALTKAMSLGPVLFEKGTELGFSLEGVGALLAQGSALIGFVYADHIVGEELHTSLLGKEAYLSRRTAEVGVEAGATLVAVAIQQYFSANAQSNTALALELQQVELENAALASQKASATIKSLSSVANTFSLEEVSGEVKKIDGNVTREIERAHENYARCTAASRGDEATLASCAIELYRHLIGAHQEAIAAIQALLEKLPDSAEGKKIGRILQLLIEGYQKTAKYFECVGGAFGSSSLRWTRGWQGWVDSCRAEVYGG